MTDKIFDTFPNSVVVTPRAGMGGIPKPSTIPYKRLDENEVAFRRMGSVIDRMQEVEQSDLPDDEKRVIIDEYQKEHEAILRQTGTGQTEESWIDPMAAVAGPIGFSKAGAMTLGALTRGAITGTGKLSNKSLVKAVTASLVAELPAGAALETVDENMPVDTPWYIQAPLTMATGIAVGGFTQAQVENSISAMTNNFRKAGLSNIEPVDIQDAVKTAKNLLDTEIKLVNITQKGKAKKARIEEFKAPKTKSKKKTGKDIAKEIKATKTPLFSSEIVESVDAKYAGLERVKEEAIGIFPDSFIEAENVDEFFDPGPLSRKLIAKLKEQGFDGVKGFDDTQAKKFFIGAETDTPKESVSKTVLTEAKNHAGASSVSGMTTGIFAGIETDDEGNITGFNVNRALAVTALTALGVAGYSKFIAGQAGVQNLPKTERMVKQQNLANAKKLAEIDTPDEAIGLATGFYKGPDNQWRTYVPDTEMTLKNPVGFMQKDWKYDFKNLISHPELEKYYPELYDNLKVVYTPRDGDKVAAYDMVNDVVHIFKQTDEKSLLKDVSHEVQHAIQKYEGLSIGTSADLMDQVLIQALTVVKKPIAQRTTEDINLLQAWKESVQTLPKENQRRIQQHLTDWTKALKANDARAAEIELLGVSLEYSPAAYWNAYGEVEARAVESAFDTGAISIADLSKPGYIQAEKLIGSLWDVVAKNNTREALDATTYLASKMDSEGIPQNIFKRWENYANNRIIDPIKFHTSNTIYNDGIRKLLDIQLPKKFRQLKKEYERQSNRTLDHTLTIAKRLDQLAPTQKEQKRLLQVLRGGVTSDPELAQAASEVQSMFKDLRELSLESGLRNYDMYDALTRDDRRQLANVIRFSDNKEKVLKAQDMLKAHYRAGTSYEYVPTFMKKKEGIVGKERKALKKRLNALKAQARRTTELGDDQPLPHLKDEIASIEEVLAINKNNAFNTERKQLSRGYVNVTAPDEASRYLFDTEEGIATASFTAARGLTEQAVDLQRLEFLKAISRNEDWALPKDMPKKYVPANFKQLNGDKYGPLNGMYVERDIVTDIDDMGEVTSEFIRNWDKALGFWKLGKAVYNPATHIGNFTSNVLLAHLGGVNPWDMKTYAQAAQALQTRMKNKYFAEAESWGLMNNTFSAAELSQLRNTLADFRDYPATLSSGQKVKQVLANVMQSPATLYEQNEQFFKMAVFIKARKEGNSISEAAEKAEEYLFNYRDIPPIVRHYKRWASPFFTFTYKASGLLAKEAIRHPHKLALWGAAYMGMHKAAEYMTGISQEQIKQEKATMPGLGVFNIPLPWTAEDGSTLYWDISRLVPLGQFEQKWGQTELPVGAFAPTANPLTAIAWEIAANREIFTGQDIVNNDIDPLMAKLGYWANHIYKELTPSLAPGNYSYNSLIKGLKSLDRQVLDYTGQEVTMQDMIVRTIFAVKVTPATRTAMFKSIRSEVMRIDRGIGKRINRLKTQYRRGEITREEYDDASNKLLEQKRFFKERIYDRMKED